MSCEEGIMKVDEVQSYGPPPFLNKTYDMVDDSATDAVVSWSPGNNSFVVWKYEEFGRDLLPKYFKHHNFSSFVRQLNTYGFRKVDPDRWEFANKGFLRGQRHLLSNICRRKPVAHHDTPQQQQQQTQGLCVAQVGKFGLEGEVERLKWEKNVLMVDLVRLRKRQQATENDLQQMGKRLKDTKLRNQQLMFLAKASHNTSFVAQEIEGDSRAFDYDGKNVKSQPGASESTGAMVNNDDLSSMRDTGDNPFEAVLADVGGSTSVEQAEENEVSNCFLGVTLTAMRVCPREPTSVPMGEIPTETIPSLLQDAPSLDHECDSDLIFSNLIETASPTDVYSPVLGQSGNEGWIFSEVEQFNEESRTPSATTGTNDDIWEQFINSYRIDQKYFY